MKLAHLFELRVAQIRDDAVKGVVDGGLVVSLFHPGVEGLPQRLPFVLNREVDQRGGPAVGCGDGAGLEVVSDYGSAERHVQMRVDIDAAGKKQMIAGIDCLRSVFL